jgi:hypothetical protein
MKTKTFHILQAVVPTFDEEPDQYRKHVGSVEATCLEEAYFKSQNMDRHWNPKKPCRSTSIGDVIQFDDRNFMVAGTGFKPIQL